MARQGMCNVLGKIWNLRADSTWIELVKVQAQSTGRSSPGAYVRDLVWLLSRNQAISEQVIQELQRGRYGNPG